MQVQVPYTALTYTFFRSGTELRYCHATGIFEEHAREQATYKVDGIRYVLTDDCEAFPACVDGDELDF